MNYLMLSQMTSNLYKNKVGSLHYFINQNYFQVYKALKTMTKLTVLELPLGFQFFYFFYFGGPHTNLDKNAKPTEGRKRKKWRVALKEKKIFFKE